MRSISDGELKTSANANISKFIDLAVNNGANRVENIDFVISKKTLDENSKELLKEAFRDAKDKAEILAMEGNFTIAGVKKLIRAQQEGIPHQPISTIIMLEMLLKKCHHLPHK